ncbi:lipocalin family protein [Prolixibacter bellariivorans]|nr:lipocalin family protein [Prolixibacter bellariivorans]
MKKLSLLLLISFLTLTSFTPPTELLGNWKVSKIINTKTRKQDHTIDRMSFKQEGVFEAGKGDLVKSGTWSFDENQNLITLNVGQQDAHYKILKLSKTKLVIENFESKIYLKK